MSMSYSASSSSSKSKPSYLKPIVTYHTGSRDSSQDSSRSRESADTDHSYDSRNHNMGHTHRDSEASRSERVQYRRVPDDPSHIITSTTSRDGRVLVHDHNQGRYYAKEKVTHETEEAYRATIRREERIRRKREAEKRDR